MTELLNLLVSLVGDRVPVKALLSLVPILAPVIADLADGDVHLSQENRLKIQEAVDSLVSKGAL